MFIFDMNMKSCIFAHFGVISLVYLCMCMYISYRGHNRFTKQSLLIVSDVDVNMFPAMRSIPSATTDMNQEVVFEPSQNTTVTKCDKSGILAVVFCDLSQFVTKAVTAQTESNNIENVFGVL